jgi:hypothetical protein
MQHSKIPVSDEKKPDEKQRQEQAAQLEQRLNDPEWRPLAEYIRKKLGDQFMLDPNELLCLVHGSTRRPWFPWPAPYLCAIPKLLAVLSRHGPKVGRLSLDEVLDGRREKRKRPTAERNAIWKRWHDEDKIGPVKISRRWQEQTGEIV